MSRTWLCLAIAVVGLAFLWLWPSRLAAQVGEPARSAQLTAWFEYEVGSVVFEGSISPDRLPPDIPGLGFQHLRPPWRDGSGRWRVYGTLASARFQASDAAGLYTLRVGPLDLTPGACLELRLPFVSVVRQAVQPEPHACGPPADALDPTSVAVLGGSEATIDVAFAPVRRDVVLTLTPLIGELLRGSESAARISGRIAFDDVRAFGELMRYCAREPGGGQYRAANLLRALDRPPVFGLTFLGPLPAKPRFLAVRTELTACRLDAGSGRAEASFGGRIQPFVSPPPMPEAWRPTAAPRAASLAEAPDRGELALSEVVLGPGDTLSVTVPHTELLELQPTPDQFEFTTTSSATAVYRGPARLSVRIVFRPGQALLVRQLPATLRTLAEPVEAGLRGAFPIRQRLPEWSPWFLGVIPAVAMATLRRHLGRGRVLWLLEAGAWVVAGAVLVYGSRGAFGLLALAALAYAAPARPPRQRLAAWLVSASALMLVLFAQALDRRAEALFAFRPTLDLETTPVTPSIMLGLGLVLAGLHYLTSRRWGEPVLRFSYPAVVVALIGFALFDVLQKSVPSLVLVGAALAYVIVGWQRASRSISDEAMRWIDVITHSPIALAGFVVVVILIAQTGLRSTAEVLGPTFGVLGPAVALLLLALSTVQGLAALGLLFLVLYPVLPSRLGYVKAVAFAIAISLVFALGIGADDRLVDSIVPLMVSRFIYYSSVPLLLGLIADILTYARTEPRLGAPTERALAPMPFAAAAAAYLKNVRGVAASLAAIFSLIAPSAYAAATDVPLLMTYFTLLDEVLRFST